MASTARLKGMTVWAAELDDDVWRSMNQSKAGDLTLACCGTAAILVENIKNEECPRFFRHGSTLARKCTRKKLSLEYERLIPSIKRSAERANWRVIPDLHENDVFIDLLLIREKSNTRVIIQVDLSFPKDRNRHSVEREWQRLAIANDFVFVIVRSWKGTPPEGVYTCVQSSHDDRLIEEKVDGLLQAVERCYKESYRLGILAQSAPTAPQLAIPRAAAWWPPGLRVPALVRVSPHEIRVSLEHLADADVASWERHLKEVKVSLATKGIGLRVIRPRYVWQRTKCRAQTKAGENPTSKNMRRSTFDDEVRSSEARRAAAIIEKEVDFFDFDEAQDWLDGLSFNEFSEKRHGLFKRVGEWFGIDIGN